MSDFFDKVKQGISKGVATASVRSKEYLDVAKLKNQISSLQNKKRFAVEELGNMVYAMFLKEKFDQDIVKDRCKIISQIDDQIKAAQADIAEVQKRAQEALQDESPSGNRCACGAFLPQGASFCSVCGQKADKGSVSAPPDEPEASKRFCGQCREELEPGAKFCSRCGSKIS